MPDDGPRGSSFLDVGCDSGLFAIAASRLGARCIVGIDVSGVGMEESERNRIRMAAPSQVEFRRASALDAGALSALGRFDVA